MSDYQQQRLSQKINGKDVQPKKQKWLKRTWIKKKVADKRAVENEIYQKRRISYLANHKYCQCGCGRYATQIHHKRGRKGKYRGESLLIVVKFFMAVSDYCHKKIENNPEWAIKMKYSLKRNIKSEKQPIMKRLALILFSTIFTCCLFGQTPTKADSITEAKGKKYIDSIAANVTVKDFVSWADDNVSAKYFRESPFSGLWNLFLSAHYNLWLQSEKNKKPPK